MLKPIDCHPFDEIFEHQDDTDGAVRYFNATKLREYAREHCEFLICQTDPSFIEFVKARRGVEQWKVDRLELPHLAEPALGVVMPDGETLIVDGHHRLVKWFEMGMDDYAILRVPLGEWDDFLVDFSEFD